MSLAIEILSWMFVLAGSFLSLSAKGDEGEDTSDSSVLPPELEDLPEQSAFETKRNLFNLVKLDLLQEERLVLDKINKDGYGIGVKDIYTFKNLQIKLLRSNSKNIFEPKGFKKVVLGLEKMVVKRCFITVNMFSPKTYFNYLKVKKQLYFKLTIKEELKLIIKSLIFFKQKQ